MPITPTIPDARGHTRPLMKPQSLWSRLPIDDRRRAALQSPKTSPLSRSQYRTIGLLALLALPIFALIAIGPAALAFSNLPRWVLIPAAVVSGLAPALVINLIARRAAGKQIAEAFLNVQLCPSCGYDLQALHADPDGCTLCPECGGAWRVPPSCNV